MEPVKAVVTPPTPATVPEPVEGTAEPDETEPSTESELKFHWVIVVAAKPEPPIDAQAISVTAQTHSLF